MAKETKSPKTEETEKITEGESVANAMVEVEEELKKLTTREEEELKNVKSSEREDMKKVKLITSDDVTFEVEMSIVKEMETVQLFLDSSGSENPAVIPLPNVTSHCLGLIIEYLVKHERLSEAGNWEELKEFEKRFVEEMKTEELKELLLAANYLDMKKLFEFMCGCVADNIKNKSVEFIRNLFGLTNDYSPEEEAEYRHKYAWAFRNIDQD